MKFVGPACEGEYWESPTSHIAQVMGLTRFYKPVCAFHLSANVRGILLRGPNFLLWVLMIKRFKQQGKIRSNCWSPPHWLYLWGSTLETWRLRFDSAYFTIDVSKGSIVHPSKIWQSKEKMSKAHLKSVIERSNKVCQSYIKLKSKVRLMDL